MLATTMILAMGATSSAKPRLDNLDKHLLSLEAELDSQLKDVTTDLKVSMVMEKYDSDSDGKLDADDMRDALHAGAIVMEGLERAQSGQATNSREAVLEAVGVTATPGTSRALVIFNDPTEAELKELGAAEDEIVKPGSRWQRFKGSAMQLLGTVQSFLTNPKVRLAVAAILFTVGILVPPIEAALVVTSLTWGAYQLASKLAQMYSDAKAADAALSAKAVVWEVTFAVACGTVTFLTGGLAEAAPEALGVLEGASKWLTEESTFAEFVRLQVVGEEAQNADAGTVAEFLQGLNDIKDAVTGSALAAKVTVTKKNHGTLDDLTLPPKVLGGGVVSHVMTPTKDQQGFVLIYTKKERDKGLPPLKGAFETAEFDHVASAVI